jgi:galactitol-specific phosphotransferase system IIC component
MVELMRERFKTREIHVAVDCAELLGNPAFMASLVILFPLNILLLIFA